MSKSFFVILYTGLSPFTNVNDDSDNEAGDKAHYSGGENNAGD